MSEVPLHMFLLEDWSGSAGPRLLPNIQVSSVTCGRSKREWEKDSKRVRGRRERWSARAGQEKSPPHDRRLVRAPLSSEFGIRGVGGVRDHIVKATHRGTGVPRS